MRVKSGRLLGGRELRRSEYCLKRTVEKKNISGRFIVKFNLNKKKLMIRD